MGKASRTEAIAFETNEKRARARRRLRRRRVIGATPSPADRPSFVLSLTNARSPAVVSATNDEQREYVHLRPLHLRSFAFICG
jgi:hypothetical protein